MEKEQLSFAECLKEAQQLGYAEADPTFDVGGFDTAHKLAILTSLAFGTEIDAEAVYVEGISSITLADLEAADELGYRIKLLGVAQRTDAGIEQRVHPTMVPKGNAIARGRRRAQRGRGRCRLHRPLTLIGPGAGGAATASAVVADIMRPRARRARRRRSAGRPRAWRRRRGRRCSAHEGGYYIRLAAVDRPGAAATIARAHGRGRISRSNRSCSAAATARPHGGDDPRRADEPAPVVADHLCYDRGCGAPGARRHRGRTASWRRSRR